MRFVASAQVLALFIASGSLFGRVEQVVPAPATAAVRDLNAAEQRWRKSRPEEYEFSIEVRCFCVGIVSAPPRYRVSGERPSAVPPVPPRASETYEHFNTVDKLFVRIRQTIQRGEHKVAVSYHESLGYLIVADLDPRDRVFDDELFFRIHNFSAR